MPLIALLAPWLAPGLLATAGAAEPGAGINEGLAIHLTNQGLSALGDAVRRTVPASIPISASSGSLSCSADDPGPLDWSLDAFDVLLSVDEVRLDPAGDALELSLYGTLGSTASALVATGDCSVLEDLDESCGLQLPTTALEAHFRIGLELVDGEIVATAEDPTVSISPVGNPLSDCTLASAIGTVLGQDPNFISTLLLSFVEPELAGLGDTVETALVDGLSSTAIETDLDLLGVQAAVSLAPTALELSERGVILGFGGGVYPESVSDCVDSSAGSLLYEQGWPDFAETAAGTSLPHDAAIWLGADFLDQALYNLWAAGLLCIDAGEMLAATGLELSPGLVDSLTGGSFVETFGEDAPISLVLDPASPPKVRFDDDAPPLSIDPGELRLELWSELDDRAVRVFAVDIEVEPGIDVYLLDGSLRVDLLLEVEDIRLVESYNELVDPGFSDGIAGLLQTALPGQLPENPLMSMALPAPLGIGIGPLTFLPHHEGAWLGGFLLLDTSAVEPVELAGCSLDGFGCDGGGTGVELDLEGMLGCSDAGLGCAGSGGTGCEEGATCTTAGSQQGLLYRAGRGRILLLLGILGGIVMRRRRG